MCAANVRSFLFLFLCKISNGRIPHGMGVNVAMFVTTVLQGIMEEFLQ
jgi:hypothetical protein